MQLTPDKEKINHLLRQKGLVIRKAPKNWFWMYKSVIDKYAKELGAYGIAIYTILNRYTDNENSSAMISYNKLAELLGCTKKTVIAYIKKLEELRLIVPYQMKSQKGEFLANVYYITGGIRKTNKSKETQKECVQ